MAEQEVTRETPEKTVGLNIRLAPVNNSDQPVFTNFTRINGAPGMVFVDFGFLEPAALDALSRLARTGGKIPETLTGKLAVRLALGFDTLAALHQQLGQVVAGIRAQGAPKPAVAKVEEKSEKKKRSTKFLGTLEARSMRKTDISGLGPLGAPQPQAKHVFVVEEMR